MFKKAQGISIRTVIIAAIALIILVVLIAIFTGRFGLFSAGLDQSINICELPGTGRACCDAGSFNAIPTPSGGKWSDCGNRECCSSLIQDEASIVKEKEAGTDDLRREFDIE